MNPQFQTAIVDADFAFKIGEYQSINVIEQILPKLVGTLYIHKHVYDNEILTPQRVKDQINTLIQEGRAFKVDRPEIAAISPEKAVIYDATIGLLQTMDERTVVGGKNWGEIVSLATAKALNIPILLSDEATLQALIDETINSGNPTPIDGDIHVFRIIDFVSFMNEIGEDRKAALWIWLSSGRKSEVQARKKVFQTQLWPVLQQQ